ncbi:MAG: hypothetical protein AABY03_00415 [Nanoarchaeota archaeon]
MKIIKKISEDEMISEFLKGEVNSPRFGKKIIDSLKRDKKDKRILLNPNLNNKNENIYRKNLLGKLRGFGRNKDIFEKFPKDIKWFSAIVTKTELKKIKYIDYSYWNELSNKTRLPSIAAKNIKKGLKVYGIGNEGAFEILAKIKKGKKFPQIILVAKNKKSKVVVLEGHARITAYFLEQKYLPNKMEVIIGYSNKISKWDLY